MPKHALAVLCVLAAPFAVHAEPDDQLAIVGVSLIDVSAGEVLPGRTIVIEGDRIVAVQSHDDAIPPDADRIDGAGLFALPGLIDSHVHYVAPEVFDPLMVAFGVVMVRDLGSATEAVLPLRDRMNADGYRGPRMIATGAILDGNPPIWPFSEVCETPDAGRAAVRKLAGLGVDQIKVYSRLEPEVYRAICDEAKLHRLPVVGHVPLGVGVSESIAAGQLTIEHLTGFDGLLADRLIPELRGSRDYIARSQAWEMIDELSDDDLRAIARPFAEAGVAQCPTLVVMEGVASYADAIDDPMYKYAPSFMKQFWESGSYAAWGKSLSTQIPGMMRLVGALHRAGAPIIAGTDLANPNVIAGYSLHRELELLVECGLSPAEALRAATTSPARLFDLDDFGAIAPGAEATLLLLEADPLGDIAATRSIRAVIHRGEHLDRAALDDLLEQAAQAASAKPAPTDETLDLADIELPGQPTASGVYTLRFGTFDAGTESFRVTKDADGYHIAAHNHPLGGPQPPFVLTLHTDADRVIQRATYRPLREGAKPSEYTREGATLIATCGDERQEFPLPEGALVTGPANIADFCVLPTLDLDVGEAVEGASVSFGFPSWKWMSVPIVITRLPDETIETTTGSVETKVFRQVMQIEGFGTFDVTSYVDARGVTVRSATKMPFGSLAAELAPLESPHEPKGD